MFRPSHVVATDDGTIFVADAATKRVQMFDSGGTYLKALGREGQGPGGFAALSGMTIAGDLLVIHDRSNNRFSTWTPPEKQWPSATASSSRSGADACAWFALSRRHEAPRESRQRKKPRGSRGSAVAQTVQRVAEVL